MADASRRFVAVITLLTLSLGLFLGTLIAQDDADEAALSAAQEQEALLQSSPLPIQPQTAPELFEAAVLMVDLARPKLAAAYFGKFLELKPDDATLLNLRDQYGPAEFLKLANTKELQPGSKQLLDKVNELMKSRAADPERIARLVDDLQGNPEQRLIAKEELINGGQITVVPLLDLLRKDKNPRRQRDMLYILTQIGSPAEAPLLAALDGPDDDTRAGLLTVLGHVGNRRTLDHLWYYANSPNVPDGVRVAAHDAIARIAKMDAGHLGASPVERVAAELHRLARMHYQGEYKWPVDGNGEVEMWMWKREAETVAKVKVTPQIASSVVGSKFARQALSMSPENRDIQVLFLSMALAAEGMLVGWDKPLPTGPGTAHDLALVAGEDVVVDALKKALESGQIPNAVASLRVLGQIGTLRLTRATDQGRSPLLEALDYPNVRVQFAAAGTIMQLDPQERFHGADRVVSIFSRALTGRGKPVALVVDPNSTRASKLAGFLKELGYAPEVRSAGRDGFSYAADHADVELAFLHPNTIRWNLSETVTNFRADSRTASIPIIMQGPSELAGKMRRLLDNNPMTAYFVSTATTGGLQSQLTPFLGTLSAPPMSEEQRANQAEVASYWLAHIADGQRTRIYDLMPASEALLAGAEDSKLAENCLLALGAVATRESQTKMAKLLLEDGAPLRLRVTAALQLAYHIQRHGLVITDAQVRGVHELFDNPRDPALHTAVSAVIGSLRPDAQLVGDRLRKFEEQPALEMLRK